MAVPRRSGASRLIDWTGERCVPWTDDVQVAYEHYHRYLWAATLTHGRRVLDIGSGEGFGSAILAEDARSVDGIDIDELAVAHAALNYAAPNLEFHVGSALALDAFDDGAFDAVVSFEVIEHLVEQEQMLAEIARVLAPDGLLIVSTPERRLYSDATGQENPFHLRELSEPEFRALLATHFPHVALWGQRTMCGSRLAAIDPGGAERPLALFLERAGDEWREATAPTPMYLVAVASRAPIDMPAAESTLADHGLQLVRAQERMAARALADADATRRELRTVAAALATSEESGALHRAEVERMAGRLGAASADIAARDAQLAVLQAKIARVEGSAAWSVLQFVRGHVYRVLGEDTAPARSLQWLMHRVLRVRSRRRALRGTSAPAARPLDLGSQITFAQVADPVVSIVIAAHRGAALTQACLRAIAANTATPSYEVIVVDDAGDDDNRRLWAMTEGARVIVNDSNLGYLRSVNLGAARARGRYVVTLNNDTVVQPGWLDALVARVEHAPDIGIVVPKLLYPNGVLQEAGAIIFADGTGWNYGRGIVAEAPECNYVREVDYGSGACMLVRAELWRDVGGYDERYLPMYYEDTDLCFAARERGFRVLYEPVARVVHVEGASAGTDVAAGGKRHQELNRPKFVERWRAQLESGQLPAAPHNVRRASNRNREGHALIVDHRVPRADRDSGSLRMTHLLTSLVDMGCRVTFVPDNLIASEPYTRDLQQLGIEVLYGATEVAAVISEIGPDLRLALVSRPVIAPRYLEVIREHAPSAIVAYDTVDLHFVREERRAALGGGSAAKAATLRELELGLIRGCDVTLTVTEEERQIVLSHVPDARVVVMPNANTIAADVAPAGDREGLLFVGSFEHPPNADAVVALVNTVMPLVWRELGPVRLRIVGADAPAEVLELAGPDVEVTGWVKDLTPLYDSSRVMVAPLRYGAGMKGKVTQSLAAGLPVVTTPIGAEGLDAVDGRDMMIAEDPAELADRIVRLVRDDELWNAVSRAGQDVAARVFSPAVMRERLEELLGASVAAR
jgi:GT2 family glycosyltransferase/glycosyltransferase involved in cell wall biosynthesis/SAM-dependent methyltransferase